MKSERVEYNASVDDPSHYTPLQEAMDRLPLEFVCDVNSIPQDLRFKAGRSLVDLDYTPNGSVVSSDDKSISGEVVLIDLIRMDEKVCNPAVRIHGLEDLPNNYEILFWEYGLDIICPEPPTRYHIVCKDI